MLSRLDIIDPDSVALFTSRGYESMWSKYLMRMSVIVSDSIVYLPAVAYYLWTYYGERKLFSTSSQFFFLSFSLLLQPGQVIIDHGHFQYNGVSLGLCLFSIVCCMKQQFLLAVYVISTRSSNQPIHSKFAT